MAMSHTIVRNQKSKLEGDKVRLGHYKFEVTKKKTLHCGLYKPRTQKRDLDYEFSHQYSGS